MQNHIEAAFTSSAPGTVFSLHASQAKPAALTDRLQPTPLPGMPTLDCRALQQQPSLLMLDDGSMEEEGWECHGPLAPPTPPAFLAPVDVRQDPGSFVMKTSISRPALLHTLALPPGAGRKFSSSEICCTLHKTIAANNGKVFMEDRPYEVGGCRNQIAVLDMKTLEDCEVVESSCLRWDAGPICYAASGVTTSEEVQAITALVNRSALHNNSLEAPLGYSGWVPFWIIASTQCFRQSATGSRTLVGSPKQSPATKKTCHGSPCFCFQFLKYMCPSLSVLFISPVLP